MSWIAAGLIFGATFTINAKASEETIIVHIGQQGNVFVGTATLPEDLRRALVLPVTCESSPAELSDGCVALNPILLAELIKTRKFEAIPADPETLRRLTGRLTWTDADLLPADFFDSLQEAYGCDAVLFCQLTVYQSLPPMEIGWRLKLVDARTRQILWAVDDIFDAPRSNPPGRSWDSYLPSFPIFYPASDRWLKRNSPRQFGQITLAKVLISLPHRAESAKVTRRVADNQAGAVEKPPMKNERYGN